MMEYLEEINKRKKRSRRVLSLKERIEVIKIAETRRDTRQLAQKFDCGRTQILSILSQKERLLREWANNGDPNRLRRRPSAFGFAINKVMYEWISRCRCAQVPLTDTAIMEKAYKMKQFFKYSEFRPNRRWLDRFKSRFRIHEDELLKPDPTFYDGIERSLNMSDIYNDIKESLDPSVIHAVAERLGMLNQTKFSNNDEDINSGASQEDSMNEQANSSNYDICEIADSEDHSWQAENFCETQIYEEDGRNTKEKVLIKEESPLVNNEPIKDVTQALECLRKLEEYSMLREDFRAIGLIGQLEKLYKGQIES